MKNGGRTMRGLAAAAILAFAAASAGAEVVGGLDPAGDNYLSLRSGPGTRYAEIARMGPGTRITVLESVGSWRRVRLEDGREGWAYGGYIFDDPAPPAPDAGRSLAIPGIGRVHAAGGVELLSRPELHAESSGLLTAGTTLILLWRSDGWLRVLAQNGRAGYVPAEAVRAN